MMKNLILRGLAWRLTCVCTLMIFTQLTPAIGQQIEKTYSYTLEDAIGALRVADALGDTKTAKRLARIADSIQRSSDQSKWVTFQIQAPDGKFYQLNAPNGLTRDEVIAAIKTNQKRDEVAMLEQRLANLRAQKVEPEKTSLVEKGRSMLNGILGPANPADCFSNYRGKARIPDAIQLIQFACFAGYSDGANRKARDAGRCILKADSFYSFEQSLSIVNKCSTDAPTFTIFKNALYTKRDKEESSRRDAARERYDRILDEQREQRFLIESGSIVLNDMAVRQFLYGK